MQSINLGRVGFALKGTWNSSTTYYPLDVVLYGGNCYAARVQHSNIAPTNVAAWQCLVQISDAITSAIAGAAVRYDAPQSLNGTEKAQARENIEAPKSTAIAYLFDPSVSYERGDYVIYYGQLYRFTADHTGAWADADAAADNVGNNLTGLKERMDAAEAEIEDILADIAYTPVEVETFTVTPDQAEMGVTLSSVSYAYTLNKVPATLKIDGNSITPAQSGNGTLTGSFSASKTWTMTATDTGSPSHAPASSSKTASITFMNRVYFGVAAIPATVNSAFVAGLTNKVPTTTRARTINLNVSNGTYAWYASPVRLGHCTFKVGGFDGGFEPAQTVSVTNAVGYTENYFVYRSTNPSLGTTQITIS